MLLEKYKGQEEDVLAKLEEKYGPVAVTVPAPAVVAAKRPPSTTPVPAPSSSSSSSSSSSYEARMIAIYQVHNPSKVGDVPMLLEKYKGQEEEVLSRLEAKYGVVAPPPAPSKDLLDWSAPAPTSSTAPSSSSFTSSSSSFPASPTNPFVGLAAFDPSKPIVSGTPSNASLASPFAREQPSMIPRPAMMMQPQQQFRDIPSTSAPTATSRPADPFADIVNLQAAQKK